MNTPVYTPLPTDPSRPVDPAADAAGQASHGATRATRHALDPLADGIDRARAGVDHLADESARMARQGGEAVARTARQWRDQALDLRESTRGYIEHRPLQAVLLAMAVGGALVMLGSLLGRGRRRAPGDR